MKKILFKPTSLLFVLLLSFFLTGCTAPKNSNIAANSSNERQTAVSAPEQDAAEPAIAAAPDGGVYVAWVEHLPRGKQANVFIRRFDDARKPLGEAVRVNPEEGRATAWRGDQPSVKTGADGGVYVVWTMRVETPEGGGNDLYLSVSRDGGKTFDAPVRINDDRIPADRGMHSLEIDKAGRVYVAWLDERYLKTVAPIAPKPENPPAGDSAEPKHQHAEPNREVYLAISSDRGKTFSANKKIAENACPCCKTSMTTAPDGRLYLAWRQVLDGDFRHIAVATSTDGGDSFAPRTIVSDDRWQIAACPVSGAGLAVDAQNNLRVAWYTAGQAGAPGIYVSESTDNGKTFAPRTIISDNATDGTPVLLNDSDGKSQILTFTAGKTLHFFSADDSAGYFKLQNQLNDVELPAAAVSKDKIYVAFIRKTGEKRNVLLSQAD